ncbi:MAG TPA: cupredoxin domain-containing protein [Allosphingosinicella sp.]
MRKFTLLAALAAVVGPAQAQDPWAGAQIVQVRLSNFDFDPHDIVLPAGRPVTLRLHNASGGGHNFAARDFLRAAQVRPADQMKVVNGAVEVRGGTTVDVGLVPAAGEYRLRCTHTFHTALGMSGSILVR